VQDITDIPLGETGQGQSVRNVSYGGVATGQAESGNRQNQPCTSGPQCKIYFGQ
jgi:hypothetical protein